MNLRDSHHAAARDARIASANRVPARDGGELAASARAVGGLQRLAASQRDVVALQRSAGNHAVGRLMRQASPDDVTLDMWIPDSVSPDAAPPMGATGAEAQERLAPDGQPEGLGSPLSRMLQRAVSARVQRKEEDSLELCPAYWRYETPRSPATYNCAGLAWRTYTYRGDIDAERSAASGGAVPKAPGAIKQWFWEYDLHLETDSGLRGPDSHDFHTVAGVVDKSGADPDDVYSKNGARGVYGPATGPSWKPPARDPATSNDPSETPAKTPQGEALYKVRSNFKEVVTCHACARPRSSPP
jgi:hypothetical protein